MAADALQDVGASMAKGGAAAVAHAVVFVITLSTNKLGSFRAGNEGCIRN